MHAVFSLIFVLSFCDIPCKDVQRPVVQKVDTCTSFAIQHRSKGCCQNEDIDPSCKILDTLYHMESCCPNEETPSF